jgi:hypothetical protein
MFLEDESPIFPTRINMFQIWSKSWFRTQLFLFARKRAIPRSQETPILWLPSLKYMIMIPKRFFFQCNIECTGTSRTILIQKPTCGFTESCPWFGLKYLNNFPLENMLILTFIYQPMNILLWIVILPCNSVIWFASLVKHTFVDHKISMHHIYRHICLSMNWYTFILVRLKNSGEFHPIRQKFADLGEIRPDR